MNLPIFNTILWIAIFVILAIKTVHYFIRIRYKKLGNWVYFGQSKIIGSQTPESARAKKIQNTFTLILIFLLMVALFIEFLIR